MSVVEWDALTDAQRELATALTGAFTAQLTAQVGMSDTEVYGPGKLSTADRAQHLMCWVEEAIHAAAERPCMGDPEGGIRAVAEVTGALPHLRAVLSILTNGEVPVEA